MRVMKCDRCKKEVDKSTPVKIGFVDYDLCENCVKSLEKFMESRDLNVTYRTKEELVHIWRANNPGGIKQKCVEDTGLSRPTVYKYWNSRGGNV